MKETDSVERDSDDESDIGKLEIDQISSESSIFDDRVVSATDF